MEMTDKAVSTEDLCYESRPQNTTCLEVARLEGVLNSLLESKVEAIKNDRTSSIHSSPRMLINRLRITSTSTVSSKDKDSGHSYHSQTNRKHRRRKNSDEIGLAKVHRSRKTGRRRQRIPSSSPESGPRYGIDRCCQQTPPFSDEEVHQAFLTCSGVCPADKCVLSAHASHSCCCRHDNNGDVFTCYSQMHYDDDYISLKIEDYDAVEEDAMIAEEELKRARRKRRKRRKRRMKRHIAIAAVPVEDNVKVLEPDDLPQRARWTIVATACLLLFMCLLLVGVTLRMAPIIDDLVRKENEELMNSLNREPQSVPNTTSPVPD